MAEKLFHRSIAVTRDPGGSLKIASAEQAAELLMSAAWPGERDEWHRDAVDACLKVIEGNRSTEDAEKAFRQAADKAGILAEG
jgi:hypothetical protein